MNSPYGLHAPGADEIDDRRMPRHTADLSDPDADVIVVGARVAGAATALLLARAGHRVVVVDRVRLPADTLSTHAIARSGMVQLAKWGLLSELGRQNTPEVRRVSFHHGSEVVERELRCSAGVDHLMAPRRHVLDPVLLDAAQAAGAEVRTGQRVVDVVRSDDGQVRGVEIDDGAGSSATLRARHVVGADGVGSTIARRVGAALRCARPSTASTFYTYVSDLDGDGFEYHVSTGSMSGVFRTNAAEACVWVCCPAERAETVRAAKDGRTDAFSALLEDCAPDLAARVDRGHVVAPIRGATRLPNQVRVGSGRGWWLVGDAAYHRDPVTGHGISDALRDAELLAASVHGELAGTLSDSEARLRYERSRIRALTPLFDVTCQMAAFPPVPRFVELQKQLSALIESEATALAATEPIPTRRRYERV